jgi:hypothetical protein
MLQLIIETINLELKKSTVIVIMRVEINTDCHSVVLFHTLASAKLANIGNKQTFISLARLFIYTKDGGDEAS